MNKTKDIATEFETGGDLREAMRALDEVSGRIKRRLEETLGQPKENAPPAD